MKLHIGHIDRLASATLTGGGWDATFVLNNLKTTDHYTPARTSGAGLTFTTFSFDLGANHVVRALALARHNLTSGALIRLRLGTTTGVLDFDSGWVAAKPMLILSDPTGVAPTAWGFKYNVIVEATANMTIRYGIVEINDTTNPAGYVEIGRAVLMPVFEPAQQVDYGNYSEFRQELSSKVLTDSGRQYSFAQRRLRGVNLTMPDLTQAEADYLHELQDKVGTTDEVLFIPDGDSMAYSQRYGGIGFLQELTPFDFPAYSLRASGFKWLEK
jgi:hypothetical protein